MTIATTTTSFGTLGTVIKDNSPLFFLCINIPLGDDHSPGHVAARKLYADLLLSGAGKYSRESFQDAVAKLGAELSIVANRGSIAITLMSDADKAPALLKLLTLTLTQPHLAPSERKRAVETISNSLELYKENARGLARDAFARTIFSSTDHRHTFTPDELIAALGTTSIKQIKTLHTRLSSAPWTVTIGGSNVTVQHARLVIERLHTTSTPTTATDHDTTFTNHRQVILTTVPSKQNIELSIGHALPLPFVHPDYPAVVFGLSVLGKWGGFSGRLMSTVREKEGLTYGIYASIEEVSASESGFWRIMTFFAPKNAEQGLNSTIREITSICEQGITVNEYERFRDILTTSETLTFDSLQNTVTLVHTRLTQALDWKAHERYRTALLSVTKDEVNTALKKYIRPEHLIISAAGPVKSVENVLLISTLSYTTTMSLLFWGLTLGTIGKILLAAGILKVHYVMARERGIDDKVIHSFYYEKIVTITGIALIVSGYLLELYFYNGAHLLTCWGSECAATAVEAIAPR